MGTIWKLDDGTCDLVWATQRIPDVHAALHEVIVNAIDAHATSVVVGLGDEGLSFTVQDNGHGIQSQDLCRLVGHAAATSKRDRDIAAPGISTYGARGDALLCLATMASVTIESRHEASWNTYRKTIERGHVTFNGRIRSKQCIPGTLVRVHDLYGNVPVRQTAWRAAASSHRAKLISFLTTLLSRLAIVHTMTSFELIDLQCHARVVALPRVTCPLEAFALLGGSVPITIPQAFSCHEERFGMSGHIAFGDFSVASATMGARLAQLKRVTQGYVCVSFRGRWIQAFERECQDCIYAHLASRVVSSSPSHEWPVIVLDVTCSSDEVALVDATPAPRVEFRSVNAFSSAFAAFLQAVLPHRAETVLVGAPMPVAKRRRGLPDEFTDAIWARSVDLLPSTRTKRAAAMSPMRHHPPAVRRRRCTKYFGTATATSRDEPRRRRRRLPAHVATHLSVFVQNPRASRTLSVQFTKASLRDITVLGQVDRKFILFATRTSPVLLCAIDQHAADERIQLEALEATYLDEMRPFPRTELDELVQLQLNFTEQVLVQHHAATLQHWGFTINARQELTTVPFVVHRQANEDDCTEYLVLLADADRQRTLAPRPPVILRLLHSRACRSAIMFGDALSQRACELLLEQLSQCRLPFQCAHGRPSLAPLVQLQDGDAS
ncbi:hypothetical protein SDRG_05428 [Saprolegnia diclina VS20]|uniref:MutL C-terminal dimerisation domain-containing protein n=1 Tax=Saprolegnia diclina (strain VS20) TaxID=1156394 RepID=T0S386_SAPDV|nr:hypothetical protein SDRG_05428 [Saprolegnia diclina VS20]EQC37202.1 hypothetical protein SDRG_05428 [Saprolegnia diclina VS20]|eukprot:XP_008609364.1 hypothetical protein SDRG_05428 [Saprolegnia diclina VS20]